MSIESKKKMYHCKIDKKMRNCNTALLLILKTLTSNRTSRKVSIGGSTTGAWVKSNNKRGHIACDAGGGRWNGSGDVNDGWSGARGGDGQQHVVMKHVGNSCDGGSVSSVLLRDGL